MAFHGDLSSYPLPDLLQWLDASKKTGALSLSWEADQRKVFLLSGQIIASSAPGLWERLSRVVEQTGEARGDRVLASLKRAESMGVAIDGAIRQIAEEELVGSLVDLIPASGRFHWSEDSDRGEDEWASLELPLRHVLFETLRRMDEVMDVERALPHEQLVLRGAPGAKPSHALHRAILAVIEASDDVTLSRIRLSLGLARSVATRAVFDMLRTGRAVVVGAAPIEADPIADMLEKGAILVRERQFDAAALIFASLLQSDPGDRRVREFARMVEREHVAAMYREMPPLARFEVTDNSSILSALRPEERSIVRWFQAGWDLSAVVLASTQRELETIKSVMRLVRMGALVDPLR
jgi:ABC-type transporter Mla MlaB component